MSDFSILICQHPNGDELFVNGVKVARKMPDGTLSYDGLIPVSKIANCPLNLESVSNMLTEYGNLTFQDLMKGVKP